MKQCGIHPCSIKVLLNSRLGASSWLEDLSAGCQNAQQREGKHLDGIHLYPITCEEQKKSKVHVDILKKKKRSGAVLVYLLGCTEVQRCDDDFIYRPFAAAPPSYLHVRLFQESL